MSMTKIQNHSIQDSHVVPHHGTNWTALWLTAQIGRDAVLSESYDHGYMTAPTPHIYVDRSSPKCCLSVKSNSITGKGLLLLRAQTSKGRSLSVISHSTWPPLSAQRTGLVAHTLSYCLLGSSKIEGECKSVPHWGSLIIWMLEWKLRMQRQAFSSRLEQASPLPKARASLTYKGCLISTQFKNQS